MIYQDILSTRMRRMRRLQFVLLLLVSLLFACKSDDSSDANPNSNAVGSLSKSYLSAEKYKALRLDLYYEQGTKPEQAAVNALQSFLESHLNKPSGITINLSEIPDQQKGSYSLAEIRAIESSYRNTRSSASEINAFLFYANGDYSSNTTSSQTLGIAYGSSSMVVFGKTIRAKTGGLTQPDPAVIEESVMKHEMGHLLGLVNLGAPLQSNHQDEANGKHCDNEDCLMYWATETGNFINNLSGGTPQLDANCVNDLKANGGK